MKIINSNQNNILNVQKKKRNYSHPNFTIYQNKYFKRSFPVINSLIPTNTYSPKKKKHSKLYKNLTDIFQEEDYLFSIIDKILEKEKTKRFLDRKKKLQKYPETITINLIENPSNNIYNNKTNINNCLIKEHLNKNHKNKFYNY